MKAYINSIHSITAQGAGNTAFKLIEPKYSEVLGNGGELRRMSKLVKLGMFTAQQCLNDTQAQQVDAIVVGTGLGGVECSEKFLGSLLQNEISTHSPTPFIQSLPNAIAGQIALKLKCYGYNMTYVHRGFSFESALTDALMLIQESDQSKQILVGGLDELTPNHHEQMRQAGHLKEDFKEENAGIILGEGVTFMQISTERNAQSKAEIKALKMLYCPENANEISVAIQEILANNTFTIDDIDFVLLGNCGDSILDEKIQEVADNLGKKNTKMYFKQQCGEYHTASGFALWQAVEILNQQQSLYDLAPKSQRNALIVNHYNDINYSIFLLSTTHDTY